MSGRVLVIPALGLRGVGGVVLAHASEFPLWRSVTARVPARHRGPLDPYASMVDGPTMRTGTLEERAGSAAVLPNTAPATP